MKYYTISCHCTIEVRPNRKDLKVIKVKHQCPKCGAVVNINYYKNILTPGYSDYEGDDYLFEGGN